MYDKEQIREKLKIKRRYFQNVQREMADVYILENFLNAFGGFDSFFIYNSFGSEADTGRIIMALLSSGKKIYLPRVQGENLVAVPYGQTRAGAFGIKEPAGQPFTGDIDITVVPLLAVNDKGYRIGYGKGFYDRYLKNANTKKVGLGYSFQIESFIANEWDEPLDLFLSEKGIYYYDK